VKQFMAELYITLEFSRKYSLRKLMVEDIYWDLKIRINDDGEVEFSPGEFNARASGKKDTQLLRPAVQISLRKEKLLNALTADERSATELEFGILHDVFFQVLCQLGCLREAVFSNNFKQKLSLHVQEITSLGYEFEIRTSKTNDGVKYVH